MNEKDAFLPYQGQGMGTFTQEGTVLMDMSTVEAEISGCPLNQPPEEVNF